MPEINPGVVVKLIGDLNSPNSWFATFDDAKRVDFYRTTIVPRGASAPLSWQLSLSVDENNGAIEYEYDGSSYETWLREVRYGGSYSIENRELTHGNNFVRFVYAQREDNDSSFLSGGESRSTKLLTNIVVGEGTSQHETVNWEYAFRYTQSLA